MARPKRSSTRAVVLHRFAADADGNGATTFEEAMRFFLVDPEGLATILLPGSYLSKRHTIARWKRDGVPLDYRGRGFVPYHFLVDLNGVAARMLPIDVKGAHAGRWNSSTIAIACLGNADVERPPEAQIGGCASLLADILRMYPTIKVHTHDETLLVDGHAAKGCAGRFFPDGHIRRLAEILAGPA